MIIFLRRIFHQDIQFLSSNRKSIFRILTSTISNYSELSTSEFKGELDKYNGVIIDSIKENCNIDSFSKKLKLSLESWEKAQKSGIWFKVAIEHSKWVPILADNGFNFHHAKQDYVMMYKWLPKTKCFLPNFAHTLFAAGALIFNDKLEILVIKDKHFLVGHWKFPGGIIEPGENIIAAAKREVREETNVTFDFKSLVCFMHATKGNFGCSDFYVLVAGHVLTADIKICPREIAECRWMDIKEYREREDVTPFNKEILNLYLKYQKENITIDCKEGFHKVSGRSYFLYGVNKK